MRHYLNNFFTLCLLSLSLLIISGTVHSHSRGESYSNWVIQKNGQINLTYTLKLRDISQLGDFFQINRPDWQQRVSNHLEQNTQVHQKGAACKTINSAKHQALGSYFQFKKTFSCKTANDLGIHNNGLFNLDKAHMHIARIHLPDKSIQEKIFLSSDRKWEVNESGGFTNWNNELRYLLLGAEHILLGWDHLAFLACLALLIIVMNATLKALLVLVTGFTIGHSISLIMTMLGFLEPNGLIVESLIAFSISLLAIEAIAIKDKLYRSISLAVTLSLTLYLTLSMALLESIFSVTSLSGLIIFCFCYFNFSAQSNTFTTQLLLTIFFGLIHGFGFAGSLQEIGLPEQSLLSALVSFNIGVEFGQLLVIGLSLFYLRLVVKLDFKFDKNLITEISAACLCGLGVFWFIERSFL